MKTPGDQRLVDTNVLVYAHFSDSKHYQITRKLFRDANRGKLDLAVTPQILLEFFAVVTNHRRVTNPFQTHKALDAIDQIITLAGITVLPTSAESTVGWMTLARQHPVRGPRIFDYLIVATMLNYGIRKIYTYDEKHFRQFKELIVIRPS